MTYPNDYSWWEKALKGERGPVHEGTCWSGYYRSRKKDKTYSAWAYWKDSQTGEQRCHENGREVEELRALDQFPFASKNPITEEAYFAFLETRKWPDIGEMVPAVNRDVSKNDNAEPDVPLDQQHATMIDNAIAAALKKVTTEQEAALALGSKNRIAELRLAADKAGKAIYEPIYRQYTAEQKLWSPIVKRAQDAETTLNKAILTFRESERVRIAKEQAEADEKRRLLDEENSRRADRSIANGEPEKPPVVEEIVAPAPAAPLVATYGTRKLKEELHTILDAITDYDAVYAFLKAEPKIKALLLELATAKIKAGFTVPGTTTRQGLI